MLGPSTEESVGWTVYADPVIVLRDVLSDVINHSSPWHSATCAGQDDEADCICATGAIMERAFSVLSGEPPR